MARTTGAVSRCDGQLATGCGGSLSHMGVQRAIPRSNLAGSVSSKLKLSLYATCSFSRLPPSARGGGAFMGGRGGVHGHRLEAKGQI